MNALATKIEDLPLAPAPSVAAASPMIAIMHDAIQKGLPIEVIRELKAMAKEVADEEASRAFKVAFAAFKAEVVTVIRNKEVTDGPLKGRKYAELFTFVDAATPALSKHGLSASWSVTRDEKDWIEVTCIIEHALGGRKQVSQGGPPDVGGAKNPLQARISSVTYLERATFKAACGLAERNDDDDGASAGGAMTISDEQLKKLQALASDVGGDVAKLCAHFKIDALPDLPLAKFAEAVGIMELKRQKVAAK